MRYWHAAKSWSCWNSAGESFSFWWEDFSLVAVAILSQLWSSLFGHLRVFWPQPGSCHHMLDFTQTRFGNSPMTLSQSPLKPDYPNQLSCLLKENLALESVFYKGTNHRTKKSAYFFSEQTWLVRQKGFQSYYRISLELSKPSKKLWALAQKGLAVRVAALVKLVSWRYKMAIILPTGQWYAPSAVINDEWYCMVLHGIAWYCMVLHCIAWY